MPHVQFKFKCSLECWRELQIQMEKQFKEHLDLSALFLNEQQYLLLRKTGEAMTDFSKIILWKKYIFEGYAVKAMTGISDNNQSNNLEKNGRRH